MTERPVTTCLIIPFVSRPTILFTRAATSSALLKSARAQFHGQLDPVLLLFVVAEKSLAQQTLGSSFSTHVEQGESHLEGEGVADDGLGRVQLLQ